MAKRTRDALDALDRRILVRLQRDATLSLDQLAAEVGASKTPVWNRIRKLRDSGVIDRQVAVLDPEAVGLGACFFVLVRTSRHEPEWLEAFTKAVEELPEIVAAHRLAGEIDYVLQVRVADARAYDAFYRRLIDRVSIYNVTSLLSMEEMKAETALPIPEDGGG
ncbi:MAG TPA: Lrp/AsnC family transcriptional regulator [Paracoccaceae bacterium]|nr:Lrp/AsnC family transcriptional regulator [Paracoccaceae bacterium]